MRNFQRGVLYLHKEYVIMSLNLGMFQIALMLFAPLIPLIYCLKWRRESLRKVIIIFICCNLIVIVIGYRITIDLGKIIEPILGYFTGKFILFTLFPPTCNLENHRPKSCLFHFCFSVYTCSTLFNYRARNIMGNYYL